ncbi:hypothetical protein A2115_01385 [Candidatus Woesebacteria bacterium GWA1_41_8]|uniref:Nudix hydrolase domain-containing protein n=1 Tax=Candidatus Woesebacteria bacterium GWA1_41_8 TaxID=1802471 RepID=A0A1F7WK20_9BACT|nr:MAG: hypothetical protein A2115_01385 [Candidatus Woesebacteria bacterium GWA1_41_8]
MLKIKPLDYKFCPLCGTPLLLKLDEGKQRKYCGACGWIYYPHVFAAVGAVIRKANRVLMVRRAREPFKQTWMFPAGFVDYGEHPEETLRREVKEETGLGVKSAELLVIQQNGDDPRALGHFVFFYDVETTGKIKNMDNGENEQIAWVDIKNPPEIGWENHKQIMEMLQAGKLA